MWVNRCDNCRPVQCGRDGEGEESEEAHGALDESGERSEGGQTGGDQTGAGPVHVYRPAHGQDQGEDSPKPQNYVQVEVTGGNVIIALMAE